jgi:hypothetical protein
MRFHVVDVHQLYYQDRDDQTSAHYGTETPYSCLAGRDRVQVELDMLSICILAPEEGSNASEDAHYSS